MVRQARVPSIFSAAPKGFRKYRARHYDGHIITVDAEGMPFPMWPDGRWCLELALYLNFGKARSKSAGAKSQQAVAYLLGELVRFCFRNRIGFLELTNSHFELFIQGLFVKVENKFGSMVEPRSTNRILKIGREALSFLFYVGELFMKSNFVGINGTIHGEMKLYSTPTPRGSKPIIRRYWHHASFPSRSPIVRRHPISDEHISLLRRAVIKLSRSPFLRQRRLLSIRLFDATGARRIELVNLTMSSVADARAMVKRGEAPFLRIPTFKKRSGPKARLLPIDEVLLAALEDFINIYRAPIIAKVGFNCEFVLIGHRGNQLEPNTLTQELHHLRKIAGITGKAHPHLFRHRYVSRRIKELIQRLELTTSMSVIEYLVQTTGVMTKLLEETGHANIASLEPYIDDLFAGASATDVVIVSDNISRISSSVKASIEELESMKGVVSHEEFARLSMASLSAYSSALNSVS